MLFYLNGFCSGWGASTFFVLAADYMKVEAGLTSDEIAQVLIGYGVSGFISKVLLGVSGKPQKPYPPSPMRATPAPLWQLYPTTDTPAPTSAVSNERYARQPRSVRYTQQQIRQPRYNRYTQRQIRLTQCRFTRGMAEQS